MHDFNAKLCRHQRSGRRRIHVADDKDGRRLHLAEHRLQTLHDLGGLLRVAAAAGAEKIMRRGQIEIAEELPGHFVVIMLPGMHEHGGNIAVAGKRLHQRRDLHEIGPRAGQDHQPNRRARRGHCAAFRARMVS